LSKYNKPTQEQWDQIESILQGGGTKVSAAEKVLGSKSKESTIRNAINRGDISVSEITEDTANTYQHAPKVLFFDIETAPNKMHGWSLWNQNFGLNQIESEWFLLSYSAKWLGQDTVMYEDMEGIVSTENDRHLLDSLWKLIDEADIVIGQNSKAFDIKKMNARWIMNGYLPPSPYKQIDTLDIAKRNFAFTSRKLEWMTDKLCTNKKLTHGKFAGFQLWKECMLDNPEAWLEMKEYNIMDVVSLEELYLRFAAWDNKHVNFNLYNDTVEKHVCRCGSHRVVEQGYAFTGVSKFQQYRCLDCGTTTRGRTNLFTKEKREQLHVNVAG
tara:strand:+ start:2781 stop:3761 length:981 start_codon:yes stop_codon:yes gene_type:complete